LTEHGIGFELLQHPRSCGARDTALAAHVPPDHIAKGVLVGDDAGWLLAVIPGSYWLRLEALRRELDRPGLELASEPQVLAHFEDCEPGSVPPLAAAYGLDGVLDEALTGLANVYIETGDHRLLAHLDGAGFEQLTRGLRRGHFSHQ
jgi:Ala-tRNA(Pro) deacylase